MYQIRHKTTLVNGKMLIDLQIPSAGIVVDFGKKHFKKAPFQGKKAHF